MPSVSFIKINMKKLILSILTVTSLGINAQCTVLSTASYSGDTLYNTLTGYHSSVAFNPDSNVYYSANPGGSLANETFDSDGLSIGTSSAMDYRGIWYNPSTKLIEGNGWGGGLVESDLSVGGKLGTTTSYVFSAQMPETQSVGAYNPEDTIVYYYSLGDVYKYKRTATGSTISIGITGVSSFTSISSKTIIYTGCTNNELGIYDFITKQLHLINELTGAITNTVDFPVSSPSPSGLWGISYANNIFWLYESSNNKWVGFNLFENNVAIDEDHKEINLTVYPNPTQDKVTFSITEQISSIELYNLTGQKVAQFQNTNTINISNLPNGIYTAKVIVGNSKPTMHKLVKE